MSKQTTPTYLAAPVCKAYAPPARPPAPPPPLAGPGACRARWYEPPPSPQRPRPHCSARFCAVPRRTAAPARPPAAGATARQAAVAAAGAEGALPAPLLLRLGLLLRREP
ncbi:hypothetical protein NN561_010687 [Cricetulus griseus]